MTMTTAEEKRATTMQKIGEIFRSGVLTPGEMWVVRWQFRLLGDFQTALSGAITRADDFNLDRLALGFPDEVAAYRAWAYGDLAGKLRNMGLDI